MKIRHFEDIEAWQLARELTRLVSHPPATVHRMIQLHIPPAPRPQRTSRHSAIGIRHSAFTPIELLVACQPKSRLAGRRPIRTAFTLIELLVVIAIIAILAALLMPGLKQARNQAKQITCMAHLKQVGVGLLMLADDNEGWIDASHIGTNLWLNAMKPYNLEDLVKYVPFESGSRGCPTYRAGTFGYSPYGCNAGLAVGVPDASVPPHSFRDVTKPSLTFLVADCYVEYAYAPGWLESTVYGRNDNPPLVRIYPRHESRGLNFIFCDGHGEFLKAGDYQKNWYRPSSNPASALPVNYTQWSYYGNIEIFGVDNAVP